MVSDAIAVDSLFIHGSRIDEGSLASIGAAKINRPDRQGTESTPLESRRLQKWKENEKWRETEKWKGLEKWRRDYGTEVVHL